VSLFFNELNEKKNKNVNHHNFLFSIKDTLNEFKILHL